MAQVSNRWDPCWRVCRSPIGGLAVLDDLQIRPSTRRIFRRVHMKMLTPWARTFIWRRGFLLWQFSKAILTLLQLDPTCSFEWEEASKMLRLKGEFRRGWYLQFHLRWEILPFFGSFAQPFDDSMSSPCFFCWCSLQPSLNNKPMMFVSSFAPSSKLTFSPKLLGRWSSRKCYSQHRLLCLAPTPVPDLVGKPRNAMFRLASWHLNAARLPMWQRSGRCLCCRLVDGVDIVFLPSELDQSGRFSSRQEQFPAQKP